MVEPLFILSFLDDNLNKKVAMEFPCKRSASPDHQYACFICLKHRRSLKTIPKKDNVTFVKETSIPVLKSMYEFWKTKANIPDKITTALSVLREAFTASDISSLAWHREKCRPIFMNKSYAERHPSIEMKIRQQISISTWWLKMKIWRLKHLSRF